MSEFYTQVKNPKWANAEHTLIDCEVIFNHFPDEWLPFTANPNDVMPYSKEIFDECVAGKYGEISEYVPPPVIPPTAEQNKQKAVQLLQETDWTTVPDVADPNLSNPYLMNQAEFITYRNQIRQIALNPVAGFIDFPIKPQEQWSS